MHKKLFLGTINITGECGTWANLKYTASYYVTDLFTPFLSCLLKTCILVTTKQGDQLRISTNSERQNSTVQKLPVWSAADTPPSWPHASTITNTSQKQRHGPHTLTRLPLPRQNKFHTFSRQVFDTELKFFPQTMFVNCNSLQAEKIITLIIDRKEIRHDKPKNFFCFFLHFPPVRLSLPGLTQIFQKKWQQCINRMTTRWWDAT